MTTDDDNDAAKILVPVLYDDNEDNEKVDEEKERTSSNFLATGAILLVLGLAFMFRGTIIGFVLNLTTKDTVESSDVEVKVPQPVRLEAFSADLSGVNNGGFGPKIAGVQLGMRMTLSDIIKWRAGLLGFPFTVEVNDRSTSAGSISIRFTGNDGLLTGFEITKATRELYRLKNERPELSELLDEIEKTGIETVTLRGANDIARDNSLVFDDELRISSIHLRKNELGGASMSHERFVEFLTETYKLPRMTRGGESWRYVNETDGWQLKYHTFGGGLLELSR